MTTNANQTSALQCLLIIKIVRMRPHHFIAALFIASFTAAPVHAKDVHCASAEKQVAELTAKLPIEVDAVTETTKAEVSCASKQVVLFRKVELKQSRMEADFKSFLQKQGNDFTCSDKSRLALTKAGWKWVFSYKFEDGEPVMITATCAK